MRRKISICALFFGDHSELATRCLGSIERSLENGAEYVQDFRLACNAAEATTRLVVRNFAQRIWDKFGIQSRIFYAPNVYKYPIMRRMFFQHEPLADATMWFDDDSYFEIPQPKGWWNNMWAHLEQGDMVGQFWLMPIQGNQWEWIKTQPWRNPRLGLPEKQHRGQPCFEFCQGGWWVIRSEVLRRYDWPLAEIRHNGGDSMLGELFRHQGLKKVRFYGGVRINADAQGRHSKAKRRGMSEKRVGWNFSGQPLDTGHQQFEYETELVGGSNETAGSPQFSDEIINLFGNSDGH